MNSHIVASYDKDLTKLKNNIIDMAKFVRDMIIIANKSLQESNESFVDIAYTTDEKINKLDSDIETKATTILALRQPMAIDLREAIAALKIAVILERMGDLSKHISTRINKVSLDIDDNILNNIHKMSQINVSRIEKVINAYKNSNVVLAKEVFAEDEEIDQIYKSLITNLEQEIITTPKNTKSIMQVIFAVKNLERIGDYISKLATLVNYIITGQRKIS